MTDLNHANVVADIVGHPKGAPTLEELDYTNPRLTRAEVKDRLDELVDDDIVRVVDADPPSGIDDAPTAFYELTESARVGFDSLGIYPEEAWTRQYSAVEKTDRIRQLEGLSRPET